MEITSKTYLLLYLEEINLYEWDISGIKIWSHAFQFCSNLTKLVLPNQYLHEDTKLHKIVYGTDFNILQKLPKVKGDAYKVEDCCNVHEVLKVLGVDYVMDWYKETSGDTRDLQNNTIELLKVFDMLCENEV